MAYSDKVLDHYENPRNVGSFDKSDTSVGTGMVGAPACGDVMKLQIKVNDNGIIEDARFKTYGCGSAIASSSLLTEWVKGKSLEEASQIKNSQIAEELALPPVKVHCSVLAECHQGGNLRLQGQEPARGSGLADNSDGFR
jgi:nitrogen fixation NifU-like protein